MENYNPNSKIYEPKPMSNREINDMIIHSVGSQLVNGTFRDF
jgi:hypothetical protein